VFCLGCLYQTEHHRNIKPIRERESMREWSSNTTSCMRARRDRERAAAKPLVVAGVWEGEQHENTSTTHA
jgi:hypothetical protein